MCERRMGYVKVWRAFETACRENRDARAHTAHAGGVLAYIAPKGLEACAAACQLPGRQQGRFVFIYLHTGFLFWRAGRKFVTDQNAQAVCLCVLCWLRTFSGLGKEGRCVLLFAKTHKTARLRGYCAIKPKTTQKTRRLKPENNLPRENRKKPGCQQRHTPARQHRHTPARRHKKRHTPARAVFFRRRSGNLVRCERGGWEKALARETLWSLR